MKKFFNIGIALFLFFLVFTSNSNYCFGEIYKYKDKDGVWCFTNRPSAVPNLQKSKTEKEFREYEPAGNLQKKLSESFHPKNKIEKARNATVLIENLKSGGFGSGFFITNNGYILTNRHVIKDTHGVFCVSTIDKRKFKIYGAEISDKYDLALLKLERQICPFIKPINPDRLAGGQSLYAIGMPLGLLHTITSGIFSGFERIGGIPYIQTNAQINPGNSGGPLITVDGNVVGINTFKFVGLNTEGLGFAIPINIALDEFKSSLR